MEIDKEDLKNETKETVNQVKDSFKNVDINKEAKETKGFVKEKLVAPFEGVEKIAKGEEDAFKKAIMLLVINVASALIVSLIGFFKYNYGSIGNKLWNLVESALYPILAVLVPAILILIMNKNNKKPLTTILSTLIVAEIPSIVASIIDIIETIFPKIYLISSPISTTLYAVTVILTFFGMKTLFGEEKENFIMKFVGIKFITALILYII
jgi:cytochrome bd-type quinol oxidase subunit 2